MNSTSRIGHAVRTRRHQLALSQIEVWQRGGPSNSTLTDIENDRLAELTFATARKLDKGLDWDAGTALRIWRNASDSPTVSVVHEYGIAVIHQGFNTIELPVEEIGRLVDDLQAAEGRIAGGVPA